MESKPKNQLGKGGRHCAVSGCSHGDYDLRNWTKVMCSVHNCLHGTEDCDCSLPYGLFNFPTKLKKPLERQKWIQLLNRSSSNQNKLWSPKKCSRICSNHFIDGIPTEENSYPTENMGYNSKRKVENVTNYSTNISRRRKKVKVSNPSPVPVSSKVVEHDHSYVSVSSDNMSNFNESYENLSNEQEEINSNDGVGLFTRFCMFCIGVHSLVSLMSFIPFIHFSEFINFI